MYWHLTTLKRWNHMTWKARTCTFHIVNTTMAVDDLLMQGARASAAIVFTESSQNIQVVAPEELHSTWCNKVNVWTFRLTSGNPSEYLPNLFQTLHLCHYFVMLEWMILPFDLIVLIFNIDRCALGLVICVCRISDRSLSQTKSIQSVTYIFITWPMKINLQNKISDIQNVCFPCLWKSHSFHAVIWMPSSYCVQHANIWYVMSNNFLSCVFCFLSGEANIGNFSLKLHTIPSLEMSDLFTSALT